MRIRKSLEIPEEVEKKRVSLYGNETHGAKGKDQRSLALGDWFGNPFRHHRRGFVRVYGAPAMGSGQSKE